MNEQQQQQIHLKTVQLRAKFIENYGNLEINDHPVRLFKKDIETLVEVICPVGEINQKIESLKEYFTDPSVKLFPFPSVKKPKRFEFASEPALNRCFHW